MEISRNRYINNMKLSCALCLLIVACCIVSSSAKKKDDPARPAKSRPAHPGKKENVDHKKDKKEQAITKSEDDESDESEEEESDVEEESDDEDNYDDGNEGDDDENANEEEKDNLTFLSSEEFEGDTREKIKEKGIYYSVDSIIEHFKGIDYDGITEVDEMLKRFNASQALVQEKMEAYAGKEMKVFYVVEGVNPDTRRKVAQILAHRIKGLYIVNQPRISLGQVLKNEGPKQAYYSLSKYMIANKVKMSLFHKPVVTESYWMEHASYIMAKVWEKASKLPKPGSEVYKHPEDLLVPKITFAIFNSNPPRIGKKASKMYLFEQRQLLVYKRFTGAKVHIIRFPQSAKQIADKIDVFLHGMGPRPAYRREIGISVDYDDLYGNKTIL